MYPCLNVSLYNLIYGKKVKNFLVISFLKKKEQNHEQSTPNRHSQNLLVASRTSVRLFASLYWRDKLMQLPSNQIKWWFEVTFLRQFDGLFWINQVTSWRAVNCVNAGARKKAVECCIEIKPGSIIEMISWGFELFTFGKVVETRELSDIGWLLLLIIQSWL